jgi:hypothetical protein
MWERRMRLLFEVVSGGDAGPDVLRIRKEADGEDTFSSPVLWQEPAKKDSQIQVINKLARSNRWRNGDENDHFCNQG